jgi:hypothetical protein
MRRNCSTSCSFAEYEARAVTASAVHAMQEIEILVKLEITYGE